VFFKTWRHTYENSTALRLRNTALRCTVHHEEERTVNLLVQMLIGKSWWNCALVSISSTFFEQLLHQYSFAKKLHSKTVIREKLSIRIFVQKKLLMLIKLIPDLQTYRHSFIFWSLPVIFSPIEVFVYQLNQSLHVKSRHSIESPIELSLTSLSCRLKTNGITVDCKSFCTHSQHKEERKISSLGFDKPNILRWKN